MAPKLTSHTKRIKVEAQKLVIHPVAQRQLVPSKLKKITENLDLDAIGVLHAVEYKRRGKLAMWVIDGQHRHQALLDRGMGEWEVEVLIHLDIADDAGASALFLKLNDRIPVRSYDKFRNAVTEGQEGAVKVAALCKKYNLIPSDQKADGKIACVVQCINVSKLDGTGWILDRVLHIATSAWGPIADAVDGSIIGGLAFFLKGRGEQIDEQALIRKLSGYPGGPRNVVAQAKGRRRYGLTSMAKCVAEEILDVYNVGRRSGKGKLERF